MIDKRIFNSKIIFWLLATNNCLIVFKFLLAHKMIRAYHYSQPKYAELLFFFVNFLKLISILLWSFICFYVVFTHLCSLEIFRFTFSRLYFRWIDFYASLCIDSRGGTDERIISAFTSGDDAILFLLHTSHTWIQSRE